MNFKSIIIASSLVALSLTSCSVYYTTSEVDSSLKSTVDQVNTTMQKLGGQVDAMELEFKEIHCDQKSADFVRANGMLTGIDAEMKAIGEQRLFVNQLYSQFKDYTKGKDKIQSGTPEWEKVKDAKDAFKSTLKNIQTDGNTVVENATTFNTFVTKNIVPTIQLCDVATYTIQFEKAISDLTLNQKKVGTELTLYQKQVTELISRYSATKPALCKELSADLQKINTDVTQISRIKVNLQMAVTVFNTAAQGKTKIYSCSNDWKVVADAETAVKTQQKEANVLQQSIQTTATHLQTIVIALGQ